MAALLDLPNELLNLISIFLLNRDLDTLTSLSRTNRRLRSIAHPITQQYLCLEGDFGSFRRPKSPDPREEVFLHIFSDDARAAAVRYLKVTGHIEKRGIELLARLRNVTHLEVSGAWAQREDDGDCFRMVYSLIGSFPALRTLYLRDCYRQDEDFDEFQDHLQDDPDDASRNPYGSSEIISNSLRHIVCENVDPAFRRLWLSTPGVDIVEMHMCEFDPWDHPLYPFREIGVHRMLLRDPVFCGAVKRLHIENRLVDENVDDSELELVWLLDEAYDAKNIQSFFAWRAHVLPCLQELILEVPFYLEHIPDILAALPEICPNLRVFKIEMSLRGYQDFIDHGQNSLLPSSKEFQSLEEIRLPFTGLHCDLVTALPCFFLNAPRLAHVYLSNPRILDGQDPSQQALLTCAEGYAAAVHTLRSVSWDRLATIEIGTGAGQQYKLRAFERPWWEERRGLVGWWQ